jgi:hypothetical protein
MLLRQRLPRLAPHTMLRIVYVAVDRTDEGRSVTHSHDAQGLGLTASAVRYLRALLRCSLGPLGPGTRPPCFVRLRGWTGIPTLTTLRVALLPPLKGRAVRYDSPCQKQALPGPVWRYKRRPGREGASRNTATFAVSRERRAGPAMIFAYQQDNIQISCSVGG